MDEFIEWRAGEPAGSVVLRFEQQARRSSHHLAVQGAGRAFTYEQLNAAANRLAHYLLARLGPAPAPVALLMDHTPEAIIGVLAVLKAGKFYLGLEPAWPEARLRALAAHAGAPLVLADAANLALARRVAGAPAQAVLAAEAAHGQPEGDPNLPLGPDDYFNLCYTSGSTGQPKGVLQNNRNVLHMARGNHNDFRMTPADRCALLLSCSFGAAASNLVSALLAGASLHLYAVRAEGVAGLAGWLQRQAITIYHSSPTLFRRMLREAGPGVRFPAMRLVKLGGEAVTRRDTSLFDAHFPPGCVLRNALGSTEAYMASGYLYTAGRAYPGNILPVGVPAAGMEIWLEDEAGRRVPEPPPGAAQPGPMGQIVLSSRYLSPGYWRQPQETAARFKPDPEVGDRRVFYTGDLGRWLPGHGLLHLGRVDDMVKIAGSRVDLGEVEAALLALPGVREAAVTAQPLEDGGARLVAYYVPEGGEDGLREGQSAGLRAALAEQLPAHMLPAVFIPLESLPLLSFGKVNRAALPPAPLAAPAQRPAYVAPRTPAEAQLAAVWQRVLRVAAVGVHDNYFDLGGDSLAAAQHAQACDEAFGVRLTLTDLLHAPSLAQLAQRLEARAASAPAAGPAPTDVPEALRRLGIG